MWFKFEGLNGRVVTANINKIVAIDKRAGNSGFNASCFVFIEGLERVEIKPESYDDFLRFMEALENGKDKD